MSEEKGYQGWANYETWVVNLWLGNDITQYNKLVDLVRSMKGKEHFEVGDKLQVLVWKYIGSGEPGLRDDFVNECMSRVDWTELAKNYLEEVTQ